MPNQLIQIPSPYPYHHARHIHLPCNLRRLTCVIIDEAVGLVSGHKDFDEKKETD
jgi:hypothetical protein